MSEYTHGPYHVREMNFRVGDPGTVGHGHQQDHVHVPRRGARRIETLKPTAWAINDFGVNAPTAFDIVNSVDVNAWEMLSPRLIPAGVWHRTIPIKPTAFIEPEMLAAGKAVAPELSEQKLKQIWKAMFEADPVSLADCMFSHKTPVLLLEREGLDAEYDAKLKELQALCEEKFGDVSQEWQGYHRATT